MHPGRARHRPSWPAATNERAKALAQRALRGLAGFAKALKVKYQDIEVGGSPSPSRSRDPARFRRGNEAPC
jgi:hypothetical protein